MGDTHICRIHGLCAQAVYGPVGELKHMCESNTSRTKGMPPYVSYAEPWRIIRVTEAGKVGMHLRQGRE